MPLEITLRTPTAIPVEVDAIRLSEVREKTADEVRATLVQRGNQAVPLGEFFDVTGSAADDDIVVWRGDCSRIKHIGASHDGGRVIVEGDAGMHVGVQMTAGEIEVRGNAADWVGAEMKGGRIHVRGNAGHLVGAAYRGGRRGMTGGVILVDGKAGNEVGHTLRRGVIAIGGEAGDVPGFNMIAGSLLLFGGSGIRPGANMRRGSIVYLGGESIPEMLPTFRRGGRGRFLFLRFYLLRLRELGYVVADELLDAEFDRHHGDFLESGKGEILVRAA